MPIQNHYSLLQVFYFIEPKKIMMFASMLLFNENKRLFISFANQSGHIRNQLGRYAYIDIVMRII